jgi:peptidylprolyl isomerase
VKPLEGCCLLVAILFAGCTWQHPPKLTVNRKASSQDNKVQLASANESAPRAVENPQPVSTPSGLQYTDLVIGNGAWPKRGQTVVVHYTGWLTNGTKFDSSHDRNEPAKFPIGVRRVVRGWDEGLATMQVGGKRRLVIPPELGYGNKPTGKIPPNSTLVFDIELLGIE